MKRFMTQSELARHYGVSAQAVHKWTRQESFPRQPIPGVLVWDRFEVDSWRELKRRPSEAVLEWAQRSGDSFRSGAES